MALAALPPRDLSWDESIVPALRKRLETESHALSKRMSAASMTSAEGYAPEPPASTSTQVYKEWTGTPTLPPSRPTAIPRPSLQQSRPGEPTQAVNGRSSRSGSFQRSRTLSQPFPFDPANPQTPPLTYPDATSRATSPMVTTPRSTRIPVSRARAGSASSHKQPSLNGVRVDSRNGSYKQNGGYYQSPAELMPDLWPVSEVQPSSVNSHSTLDTMHSQVSKLVDQRPPFPNQSFSSRGGYDSPRMSTDSEERPFEHWYRGDVSRNGGVGELRVGRRQEMLEIANYGHTLRQASSRTNIGLSRSRSSSRGPGGPDHLHHRPRAGSVGARESLYIDEEQARKEALVLDEQPLTDLDSDGAHYDDEDEPSYFDEYYTEKLDDRTVSPPLSLERSDTPSTIVGASGATSFKSRIPTPTPRQISNPQNPPRTETPTHGRSSSTAPSTPKVASPSQTPVTRSPKAGPATNGSTNANKRRAKSPAAAGSTNAKRVRKKSVGPSNAIKKPQDDKRGSVSQYPDPEAEAEDLANAIPSWTQPVPPSGNWDDVVLPVVARKKGLDGHYQRADGSPKPKPKVNVIEPAPGTFGFDHTKRRGANVDRNPEDIPMDEFGQRTDAIRVEFQEPPPSEPQATSQPPSPLPPPPRSPIRPESPAPFSHYATAPPNPTPLPQIHITRPSTEAQDVDMDGHEEKSGGCCKCVIM